MLKDLSALRDQAKKNVLNNFDEELNFTAESYSIIAAEYGKTNSQAVYRIEGSSLRFDSSSDENRAQTVYLSFQWFNRIHQCRELIEALNDYMNHLDQFREALNNDALMRILPKIDWENSLGLPESDSIKEFIESHFVSAEDKNLFAKFLDGSSWLEQKGTDLAGRKLNRMNSDITGSAIAAVTRLINDTSGQLPQFIKLYTNSENVKNVISNLSTKEIPPAYIIGGENVIYYGAPGTGKSHKIEQKCDEKNSIRTVFHPDTQNSDFIGCLKPKMDGDNVVYEFRAGPFTKAIIQAYNTRGEHHYLVIEEINRAACAAVFGEIFQLLDRNEYGESCYSIDIVDPDLLTYLTNHAPLSVDKGKLKIPSNLSLYATMNSSDQAVMPMDTAFKRRWLFEYVGINFQKSAKGTLTIPVSATEVIDIEWSQFAPLINSALEHEAIAEDRLLGPWFLNSTELKDVSAAKSALKGKLFLYLWNDVLRHNQRSIIFDDQINNFGQLIERFEANKTVFSSALNEQIKAHKIEGNAEAIGDDGE